MNETVRLGVGEEAQRRLDQERNDAEQLVAYLLMHPEPAPIAPENIRDYAMEAGEFDMMLALFESMYPLSQLILIKELTVEEASNHKLREPARIALGPIFAKLNKIEIETNIPAGELAKLKEQYGRLSRAVGMINGGKVDHTR